MTSQLEYMRALMSRPTQRQIEEQRRRDRIADSSEQIARLKVMQALATDNEDYSDVERGKMSKEVVQLRRAIVDLLSTEELTELQSKKLTPEQALQVVRDTPESPDSEEVRKFKRDHNRDVIARHFSNLQLFTAEKGFSVAVVPGMTLEEIVQHYPDQRKLLKRFEFQKPNGKSTYTTADAAINHRPDLKNK